MNQSRPRKLSRDGFGDLCAGSEDGTGPRSRPVEPPRLPSSGSVGCLDERTNSLLSNVLLARLPRLQAAGSAKHHDRLILLVFRRRPYLILGQFEGDAIALVGDASETQRVPVDDDLAAA